MDHKTQWLRHLGAQISAARKALGWSQADLAARIGVHRQTVYVWEAGQQPPDGWRLVLLVRTLGLDPAAILVSPDGAGCPRIDD